MKRAIVVPALLVPGALDELKHWLAIGTAGDDNALVTLLRAGLDMCEAFTRQMPLESLCEEVIPSCTDWHWLATRPVLAVTGVQQIASDGTRSSLPVDAYAIDLDAQGRARARLTRPIESTRLAVRFTAGLASDWASMPDTLRQGILRFAAHNYRHRDLDAGAAEPPAAIAALWSPWRVVRLT